MKQTYYNNILKTYIIKGEIETLSSAKRLFMVLTNNIKSRINNNNLITDFISDNNITYNIETNTTLSDRLHIGDVIAWNNEYVNYINLTETKNDWRLRIDILTINEIK